MNRLRSLLDLQALPPQPDFHIDDPSKLPHVAAVSMDPHPSPPPLSSPPSVAIPEQTVSYITETLTLDEFEGRAAAERAAREHDARSRNVLRAVSTNASRTMDATALGKPRSAQHIVELNQLTQAHQLSTPEYVFETIVCRGRQDTFAVKLLLVLPFDVEIDGRVETKHVIREIEGEGSYASKREAKEAVSQKGLDVIKSFVAERSSANAGRESSGSQIPISAATEVGPPIEPGENYVGLLLEYSNAASLPFASYQFYRITPTAFACEVSVQHPERLSAAPETFTYGSSSRAYNSKKAAKSAASSAAVAQLRALGLLEGPRAPPPRKKARVSSPTGLKTAASSKGELATESHAHTRIPGLSTLHAAADLESTSSSSASSASTPTHSAGGGPLNRVHALRQELGLGNVEYRVTPSAPGTSLYDGAAYFPEETRLSGLRGPLGAVTAVFGRRAAKEEVARGLVKVLGAELVRRVSG